VAAPLTQDANSQLVQVLDAYLADRAAGKAPGVEELVARHPELAAELRECLASLEMIKAAVRAEPSGHGPDVPAGDGEARTGILGDYRILREVGRGGMGIVYEAWQISLGRRVALKVLPFAATLDTRHLQRFKNEAQAAAQLHHSHIVPVFAVGVERGVHYYAMQFIEGRTLAAVIDEMRQGPDPDPMAATRLNPADDPHQTAPYLQTPAPTTVTARAHASTERSNKTTTFFRTAAQVTMQAAEALEHAHGLGVVHRDVKPANLLVDVRRHVWVTDFGLAQFGRDANLTVTGDLLGTLRYMSPEQASARRAVIDHRTDIYSLGATLCELLTLRPVFDGQDRQEILNQILNEEPTPPRRHNKAVPPELDLIAMKALAKNPEERYGTAQELADDLRRFLEDKPVLARRPTLVQHVRKWARRHQALVAAGLGFVVLALGATSVSTVLVWQERNEATAQRDEAEAQRQWAEDQQREAEKQRVEAERQRRLAWKALEEMFADTTPLMPALTPTRREFLVRSEAFYQEMARRDPGADPAAWQDRGTAFRRLGDIRMQLGKPQDAEGNYREAVRLLQDLAGHFPDNTEYKFDLVSSQLKLAQLLRVSGKIDESNCILGEAQALSRTLAAAKPDDQLLVELYAQCCEHGHEHVHEADADGRDKSAPPRINAVLPVPGLVRQQLMGGPPDLTRLREFKAGVVDGVEPPPTLFYFGQAALGVPPARGSNLLPPPQHTAPPRLFTLNNLRNERVPKDVPAPVPQPTSPPEALRPGASPYAPYGLYANPQWGAYTSAAANPYLPYPYLPQANAAVQQAQGQYQERGREVVTGESLNAVLDRVKAKHARGVTGPRTVLDVEVVRRLNLTTAQQKRPNLLNVVRDGALEFPAALQNEKLAQGREFLVRKGRAGVERLEKGEKLDAATQKELRQEVDNLNKALGRQINEVSVSQFIEARRFLQSLDEVVTGIENNDLSGDPAQQFVKNGKLTVADLIDFVAEKKLRFGPADANSGTAYFAVFQALSSYEAALPAKPE
jgi:serine/threonine protein kinase/tetratricopeptide (TPR) repeat protein